MTEIDRLSHGSKTLVGPAANENLSFAASARHSPAISRTSAATGPRLRWQPGAAGRVDADKAQAKRLLAEAPRRAFDKHDYATARIKAPTRRMNSR